MTSEAETVAVGMSGGVDSSVALALLREQGLNVFGVTARMTVEYSRCCATDDVERARAQCEEIGVPHHVVDVCETFKEQVIDSFMTEYLQGRTPSPCVLCNQTVKFGELLDRALELGADRLATGHYARLGPGPVLMRGRDPAKDQSYFLAHLTAAQLGRTLFPLGEMTKPEVQAYAARHGVAARNSKESQELCFVTEGTHGEYIDLRSFATQGAGEIVTADGTVVGQHRGIHHYTIGQRKGLGIALGHPVYVIRLDAARNQVVVGEVADAQGQRMTVSGVHWIGGHWPDAAQGCACQVRYKHTPAPCAVENLGQGRMGVQFAEAQFALTPGQLAVIYRGEQVLGCGWIESR